MARTVLNRIRAPPQDLNLAVDQACLASVAPRLLSVARVAVDIYDIAVIVVVAATVHGYNPMRGASGKPSLQIVGVPTDPVIIV